MSTRRHPPSTSPVLVAMVGLLLLLGAIAVVALQADPRSPGSSTPGLYLLESGILKASHPQTTVKIGMSVNPGPLSRIAGRVENVLHYAGYALFQRTPREDESSGIKDLWILDKRTGKTRLVARSATGTLAPAGDLLSIGTHDHRHLIMALNGDVVARVGVHGTQGVFSPAGDRVAYIKLADEQRKLQMGHISRTQGIAVYDLASKTDRLLQTSLAELEVAPGRFVGASDFGVLTWHPNGSRIYFSSELNEFEPGVAAIWSIRPDGTGRRQESNRNPETRGFSSFGQTILWSPDGRLAIGGSIHAFLFDEDGALVKIHKLAETDSQLFSLQWAEPGKTAAYFDEDSQDWVIFLLSEARRAAEMKEPIRTLLEGVSQ